jgi:hypothetical protein
MSDATSAREAEGVATSVLEPLMTPRPLTLAAAVVLVTIVGAGVSFVGLMLLAVAAGAVAFLDPVGGLLGFVGLLGFASIAVAVAIVVLAVTLWQRRSWGWVGSLAVAVAGVIGALIALGSAGSQLPIQLGLVTMVAAVALLLAPSTRSAAGIA